MKPTSRLFVLAALAVGLACASGIGSPAQDKKDKAEKGGGFGAVVAPPPKWEYKVTALGGSDEECEKALNKLGDDGWELVGTPSVVSASATREGTGGVVSTKVRLILKRAKR